MTHEPTEQEKFWAGSFGDEYTERNHSEEGRWISSNTALFARIFQNIKKPTTLLELGANRGLNLLGIKNLLPQAEMTAVEINQTAAEYLKAIASKVYVSSILDFTPPQTYDFVFTKGVLIHIQPESLPLVYEKMRQSTARYVCICEYYNQDPVEVLYRGHGGKLFKRDFAGEFMDQFPEFNLVDYGFVYHRDSMFPQDDETWFLMEKRRS